MGLSFGVQRRFFGLALSLLLEVLLSGSCAGCFYFFGQIVETTDTIHKQERSLGDAPGFFALKTVFSTPCTDSYNNPPPAVHNVNRRGRGEGIGDGEF